MVTPNSTCLLLFFTFLLVAIATSQDIRAPHGLVNENPKAFTSAAADFFHSNEETPDKTSPKKAKPVAAQIQASDRQNESDLSSSSTSSSSDKITRIGARGVMGIVLVLGVVAFQTMDVI
ncbi:hypothetical protein ACFE04_006372 [Oxalis oulophora]